MEGPPSQKALRALQGGPPAAGPSPSVRPGLRETPGRPTFCTVVPVVSFDSTCPVIRYHRIEINVNSISLLSRTETKCCDILKHLSELAKIRTRPSPFFLHSSSPVNAIPVQLTEQEENEGTGESSLSRRFTCRARSLGRHPPPGGGALSSPNHVSVSLLLRWREGNALDPGLRRQTDWAHRSGAHRSVRGGPRTSPTCAPRQRQAREGTRGPTPGGGGGGAED